jgi:hypothetical protein
MSVPICLAMVLCDAAVQDPFTKKHTLIGTFVEMAGSQFPVVLPHMVIYVVLTDGHGKTRVRLQRIDLDEERDSVFEFDGSITFAHPQDVVEMCFRTDVIQFPEPGEYRVKLFAGDEFIMERRITVSRTT